MSDQLILFVGVGVFVLMMIGIGLTIYGFHRAGSEPVHSHQSRGGKRRFLGRQRGD
ncbi:hypothetical protein [Microbulbifer elongatus]|uniref:hypothetical protein n=1 Tax=Microbulbifer elongatus TaxID=86173 RepID=UPI001CFE21A3|nr:hypothetical protein [Microbulbifer elongatus]